MIADFFAGTGVAFVGVNGDGFTVDGRTYSELQGFIRQIVPVRKLFNGRKLECYSNDAVKGRNGTFCSLCLKLAQCRKRIRLMLLLVDENGGQVPAQFEINSSSFRSLQKMLEPIDEGELAKTLVNMELDKKEGKYLKVRFSAVF